MKSSKEKISFKKRIKILKLKKSSSTPYILRTNDSTKGNNTAVAGEKPLNKSYSQKFNLNNSTLLNPNNNFIKGFSSILNSNTNNVQTLLYDDIMKLKNKINKLKLELSFLKSESRKKDEEIKKIEKFIETSTNKENEKKTIVKLQGQSQIIKLKNKYQKLQEELKEKKEENSKIIHKVKNIDIIKFQNDNNYNIDIFKEKVNEYKNNLISNKEREKEINSNYFNKSEFFENHSYLEKILKSIEIKNIKINSMKEHLQYLKDQFNKMDENKKKLLTYNDSIEKNNQKLLLEKKKREEFLMKKPVIIRKIKEFEKKAKDLDTKERQNSLNIININNMRNKRIEQQQEQEKVKFIIDIQANPIENINQKILLYDSLIKESKERQNEFIELFEYYNDYIKQKENYEIIKKEANLIEEKDNQENNDDVSSSSRIKQQNIEEKNNEGKEDEYTPFIRSSLNSTNRNNDINIDKDDENKKEINDDNNNNNGNKKKYQNFKFLLSIMINIKGVEKDKIENILLNFRTQNYFLDNLTDKNNYLFKLSKEILALIGDKNEKDINSLKNMLIYYLEEKYQNNKESFLNNIVNDFVENNQLLFNKNNNDKLLEKIKKEYSENSNSIIEKIKNNKKKIISYKNLKKLFKKENLYNKDDKEKIELFHFFIYTIKKNSSSSNNKRSIQDFIIKDIVKIFNEHPKNDNNKKVGDNNVNINNSNSAGMSMTKEESKKALDNFCTQFKSFLNDKGMNLKEFIGENNIKYIQKDENEISTVNINKFFGLLKLNKFNIDGNLNLNYIFSCYKVDENSEDININLLENDLK